MNDPIPTRTPEQVIQTYQRAKDRRRMWESQWKECRFFRALAFSHEIAKACCAGLTVRRPRRGWLGFYEAQHFAHRGGDVRARFIDCGDAGGF